MQLSKELPTNWTYLNFRERIVFLRDLDDPEYLWDTVPANFMQDNIFREEFYNKGIKTVSIKEFKKFTLENCLASERKYFEFDGRSKGSIYYGEVELDCTQFSYYIRRIKGQITKEKLKQTFNQEFAEYLYQTRKNNQKDAIKKPNTSNIYSSLADFIENFINFLRQNADK
ncbi:MAG TPA: hypothetical protein PK548_03960 [Bacteroidales bacterium]|nr:hypothetical protein [Bacteroidales bacterium]HQA86425.1 hypothetical protein [Bacteroidales bacterium]